MYFNAEGFAVGLGLFLFGLLLDNTISYNSKVFYPVIGNSTSAARWGSESSRHLMFSGTYQTNNT